MNDCCSKAHAVAIPPWTCTCDCHASLGPAAPTPERREPTKCCDHCDDTATEVMELYSGEYARGYAEGRLAGRREMREEAECVAKGCYHGPKDYGCSHGDVIAADIRALPLEPQR